MSSAGAVDDLMQNYRRLQQELAELAQQRQSQVQQANENGMVKQELDALEPNSAVYKIMGPVLLKVDLEEAKQNVNARLDVIQKYMETITAKTQAKEKEGEEIGDRIMQMQSNLHAKASEAARAVVEQTAGGAK